MMVKFDCRQINDLINIRMNNDYKDSLMIAACNDGFVKVFSLNHLKIMVALKGSFGNPLCLDVCKNNKFLAVGFEDDTFVLYSLKSNFQPVVRGVGHKSFVS
jgi:WD40 repeat protein